MPRIRKADLFEGYAKTKEPDLEKMAELTARAKGNRSLVDFACDCGLNISTLSRIINNKNSGPSADEVLARIAKYAAPESGVTIDDLLLAAGKERVEGGKSARETLEELDLPVMEVGRSVSEQISEYITPIKDVEYVGEEAVSEYGVDRQIMAARSSGKSSFVDRLFTYRNYIESSVYRQAVLDALIALKYSVSLEADLTAITGIEFDCYAEFILKTNALEAEGLDKWAFIKLRETGNRAVGKLTSYFGMMFAHNPVKEGKRITLLIEDKATYDILRELLQCVEVPASFSLMLVDTKDRKVISEYVMDRSDGVEPVRLFNAGGPTEWEEIFGVPDETDGN